MYPRKKGAQRTNWTALSDPGSAGEPVYWWRIPLRGLTVQETITTARVRQRLGDLLDRIAARRDEFVIARRGKPLAAIVPIEKLEQMERAAESELLRVLDGHARRLTQEQVDELANTAKHRNRRSVVVRRR